MHGPPGHDDREPSLARRANPTSCATAEEGNGAPRTASARAALTRAALPRGGAADKNPDNRDEPESSSRRWRRCGPPRARPRAASVARPRAASVARPRAQRRARRCAVWWCVRRLLARLASA